MSFKVLSILAMVALVCVFSASAKPVEEHDGYEGAGRDSRWKTTIMDITVIMDTVTMYTITMDTSTMDTSIMDTIMDTITMYTSIIMKNRKRLSQLTLLFRFIISVIFTLT
uniref:Uncharacterized protein n=1 Tax=Daphnia galeata TaxID=27404 RepID=A0A8J2VYM1_9CRUS|nr:unnamed protein product [Daphnia galeata]